MAQPASERAPDRRGGASPEIRLEYRGFRNSGVLREYFVHASIGDEHRDYVVTIEQSAFNERRVGFQDGPDICFQRLRRELSGGLLADGALAISNDELASYRAAHAPVVRTKRPPAPATAVEPVQSESTEGSEGPARE